jgi:hypothetical protein
MVETLIPSMSSAFMLEKIPEFIRDDYAMFVQFFTEYRKWLDRNDNDIRNIQSDIDNFLIYIDLEADSNLFFDKFWNVLANGFPRNILIDKKLFLKHSKEFFRSKGTENSIKFLFRILFDDEVTIFRPREFLFRASESYWYRTSVMTIIPDLSFDEIFFNDEFFGTDSGAISTIEYFFEYYKDGVRHYKIYFIKNIIPFQVGEVLYVKDYDGNNHNIGNIYSIADVPGKYLTNISNLSGVGKLQDSNYWQEFSYEICSHQPVSLYEDVIKKYCHPVGRKLFGRYLIETEVVCIDEPESIQSIDIELNIYNDVSLSASNEYKQLLTSIPMAFFPGYRITGTATVLDNPLFNTISDRLLKDFSHWKISDFWSGRGIIGNGTSFLTDLAENTEIFVEKDEERQYDVIEAIDTDTTCVLYNPLSDHVTDAYISENI